MLLLLLVCIILGETRSGHLGELLQLLLSIVKATKMVRILRDKVWLNRIAFADKIEAADLLLEASEDLFGIEDCEAVFKKAHFGLVIRWRVGSHRW